MCGKRAWLWPRTSSPTGPNGLHSRYESGAIFHTIFPKKSSGGATIRTIRWLLFCGVKCLKTDRSFADHLRRWADKGSQCRRLFFLSQRLASRTFVCTNVESRAARPIRATRLFCFKGHIPLTPWMALRARNTMLLERRRYPPITRPDRRGSRSA